MNNRYKCSVCGDVGDKNRHLFRYPANEERQLEWKKNLKVSVEKCVRHLRVCDSHFSNDSFANLKKNRLAANATPYASEEKITSTINYPNSFGKVVFLQQNENPDTRTCIVRNCNGPTTDPKRVYRFPMQRPNAPAAINKLIEKRKRAWVKAIKKPDLLSQSFDDIRICCDHFVSGIPSASHDINNENWIPTLKLDISAASEPPSTIKNMPIKIVPKPTTENPAKPQQRTIKQPLTSQKQSPRSQLSTLLQSQPSTLQKPSTQSKLRTPQHQPDPQIPSIQKQIPSQCQLQIAQKKQVIFIRPHQQQNHQLVTNQQQKERPKLIIQKPLSQQLLKYKELQQQKQQQQQPKQKQQQGKQINIITIKPLESTVVSSINKFNDNPNLATIKYVQNPPKITPSNNVNNNINNNNNNNNNNTNNNNNNNNNNNKNNNNNNNNNNKNNNNKNSITVKIRKKPKDVIVIDSSDDENDNNKQIENLISRDIDINTDNNDNVDNNDNNDNNNIEDANQDEYQQENVMEFDDMDMDNDENDTIGHNSENVNKENVDDEDEDVDIGFNDNDNDINDDDGNDINSDNYNAQYSDRNTDNPVENEINANDNATDNHLSTQNIIDNDNVDQIDLTADDDDDDDDDDEETTVNNVTGQHADNIEHINAIKMNSNDINNLASKNSNSISCTPNTTASTKFINELILQSSSTPLNKNNETNQPLKYKLIASSRIAPTQLLQTGKAIMIGASRIDSQAPSTAEKVPVSTIQKKIVSISTMKNSSNIPVTAPSSNNSEQSILPTSSTSATDQQDTLVNNNLNENSQNAEDSYIQIDQVIDGCYHNYRVKLIATESRANPFQNNKSVTSKSQPEVCGYNLHNKKYNSNDISNDLNYLMTALAQPGKNEREKELLRKQILKYRANQRQILTYRKMQEQKLQTQQECVVGQEQQDQQNVEKQTKRRKID